MADPIFFPTRDQLLRCMRLNVCDGDASDPVIDRAIQLAAVEMWSKLGSSLLITLQSQAYVDTITATTEVPRVQAQLLECTLVHKHSVSLLAQMSVDGNGIGLGDSFPTAPFGLSSAEQRELLLEKLCKQIDDLYEDILNDDSQGSVKSAVVGGSCFDHSKPTEGRYDYAPAPFSGGSLSRPYTDPFFPHSRYTWTWDAGHYYYPHTVA